MKENLDKRESAADARQFFRMNPMLEIGCNEHELLISREKSYSVRTNDQTYEL